MFSQKTPKYNLHATPKIYIHRSQPRFSLARMIGRWFTSSPKKKNIPFQVVRKNIQIEYGLHLKSQQTRRLTSKFTIFIVSTLASLPLLWWLNNSNAAIATIAPWLENPYSLLTPPTTTFVESSQVAKVYPLNHRHIAPKISPVEDSTSKEPIVKKVEEITTSVSFANNALPGRWLHLTIKTGDSLSKLFARHRLNKADLYQMINLAAHSQILRQLHLNQKIHIKHDELGNVESLILMLDEQQELYLSRIKDKFVGEIRRSGVSRQRVTIHATIEESLATTANKADLSDNQLNQLKDIFLWQVDLERKNKAGDQFSLIYEQYFFNGEKEEGEILAAEYVHEGKTYRALRYTDLNGYTDYYTPMGDSLQKLPLLHAPVEYKRISSYFGERKHPILKRYSFHTGVDYAAAVGTPIVAAGHATVEFVGRKGGYGKTIVLRHHHRVQTLYAHLYKFEKNLEVGDEVVQGQIIGYVGQSGRATGPHLHYEIQLDGEPIDALNFANKPLNMPVAQAQLLSFFKQTQTWVNQLNTFNPQVVVATAKPTTALLTIPSVSHSNSLISEKISLLKQQAIHALLPAPTTTTTKLEPRLSR